MRVSIWREFTFDAAHWLPKVADGHKCKRLHGHTWRVRVEITGTLIDGMVIDYAELQTVWNERVHSVIDHRLMNEIDGLGNPTTEVIAPWLWERLAGALGKLGAELVSIEVSEGEKSGCRVTA